MRRLLTNRGSSGDGPARSISSHQRRRAALLLMMVTFSPLAPFSREAFAQGPSRPLPRFRALLRSGERFEGRDGTLTPDSLRGQRADGRTVAVRRTDVRALDAVAGNQLVKGAEIGAGIGGLAGLLAALQLEGDPNAQVDHANLAGAVGGVALVSALIGAVVGANLPRWEHVSVQASPGIAGRPGVGVAVHFSAVHFARHSRGRADASTHHATTLSGTGQ